MVKFLFVIYAFAVIHMFEQKKPLIDILEHSINDCFFWLSWRQKFKEPSHTHPPSPSFTDDLYVRV